MDIFMELLKAVLFGIVEGITEWLPVSSTGHMILLDELVKLNVSEDFYEMFQVVIQLGAIAAVLLLFFHKLNPFSKKKSKKKQMDTWQLWFKVAVAVVPSAVLGLLLDDWMDEHLYNYWVVAVTLIVYGVAFLFMESKDRRWLQKLASLLHIQGRFLEKKPQLRVTNVYDIDYRTALLIGAFQCLSLIPGTSRSGSTILGAIILGVGRSAGAEFSFFLAIPTMLGASFLKAVKFLFSGTTAGGLEIMVLVVGCIVSFLVSMLVIRALMDFVRKRSFFVFGVYRIILGAVVILFFLIF